MFSKEVSSTTFESLVWPDLGLNPGLPDHYTYIHTYIHISIYILVHKGSSNYRETVIEVEKQRQIDKLRERERGGEREREGERVIDLWLTAYIDGITQKLLLSFTILRFLRNCECYWRMLLGKHGIWNVIGFSLPKIQGFPFHFNSLQEKERYTRNLINDGTWIWDQATDSRVINLILMNRPKKDIVIYNDDKLQH